MVSTQSICSMWQQLRRAATPHGVIVKDQTTRKREALRVKTDDNKTAITVLEAVLNDKKTLLMSGRKKRKLF